MTENEIMTLNWLLGKLENTVKPFQVISVFKYSLTDNLDRIFLKMRKARQQNCQNPRGDWHPGTDLAFFSHPKASDFFGRKWQFGKVS